MRLQSKSTPFPDTDATEQMLLAAQRGDAEAVSRFLPAADLSARDKSSSGLFLQRTALMLAADGDHDSCVRLLLPGSDLLAADGLGRNALMAAAAGGRLKCADALLASPFAREAALATDSTGQTALILAIFSPKMKSREWIEKLIPLSAIDAADDSGRNAFGNAVSCGHPELARILAPISDLSLKDYSGRTVFEQVIEERNAGMQAIIEEELARRESVELAASLPERPTLRRIAEDLDSHGGALNSEPRPLRL